MIRRRQYGFTLVEMMVVLIVFAIVVALGAPPMQQLLQGNRLRAEASRFIAAINLARSEAVMRNQQVSICPSSMAVTGEALCTGTYAGGWLVFVNPDADRDVDSDTDTVISAFEGLTPGTRLTNRSGTRAAFELINFLPDGTSHGNRTLLFCPPRAVGVESLSIVLNIVGRARLVRGRDPCSLV